MHCWWGESASYVLSLLKSFLMEWKPYILFPNEAQEWQTAPLGLSYGCLQVEATRPSQAAPREPAGDARLGQQTSYASAYTYTGNKKSVKKNLWEINNFLSGRWIYISRVFSTASKILLSYFYLYASITDSLITESCVPTRTRLMLDSHVVIALSKIPQNKTHKN